MRKIFVALGSMLIVVGILAIPIGFTSWTERQMGQPIPITNWVSVASRAAMSSFIEYLTPNEYRAIVTSTMILEPTYLDVVEPIGNHLYRFSVSNFNEPFYFTITQSGNYNFTTLNPYGSVALDSVEIEEKTTSFWYQYYNAVVRPYEVLIDIGLLVVLTGAGLLVFGLVTKGGVSVKSQSPPVKQLSSLNTNTKHQAIQKTQIEHKSNLPFFSFSIVMIAYS